MPKLRNRNKAADERPDSELSDIEFGMREKRLDSEQGRLDYEASLYGSHSADTPEGKLWREIFELCLAAPEAAAGLAKLRDLIATATLAPGAHRAAALMPPLGHLTSITREVSSDDNYDTGLDALLSLVGRSDETRADHAANLRSALERHSNTSGAAQWIQHQAMVFNIATLGSPDAPTRARVHTWRFVHDALWRESVDRVLSSEASGTEPA